MSQRINYIENEIIDQYLHDENKTRPWIVGFSGGKDSTVVLQLIWNALLNKIFISPELVSIFKENWRKFVITPHSPIFALSFYHLRTESFWELIAKQGFEQIIQSKFAMKTFTHLNEAVDFALIDNDLFELLVNEESRNILKISIIQKYFPHIKFSENHENDIIKKIESLIFDDKIEIQELKKNDDKEEFFPFGKNFYPNLDFLKWHNLNVFKN